MNSSAPKPRTIYLLWRANQAVRVLVDHYGKGEGVTLTQYTVLWYLSRRPGCTGAELARELNTAPQTMNETTANLLAAGLLVKQRGPSNKKNWLLSLTEAGRRRLEQVEHTIDVAEAAIFEGVKADDLALLRDLVSVVIAEAKDLQSRGAEQGPGVACSGSQNVSATS